MNLLGAATLIAIEELKPLLKGYELLPLTVCSDNDHCCYPGEILTVHDPLPGQSHLELFDISPPSVHSYIQIKKPKHHLRLLDLSLNKSNNALRVSFWRAYGWKSTKLPERYYHRILRCDRLMPLVKGTSKIPHQPVRVRLKLAEPDQHPIALSKVAKIIGHSYELTGLPRSMTETSAYDLGLVFEDKTLSTKFQVLHLD